MTAKIYKIPIPEVFIGFEDLLERDDTVGVCHLIVAYIVRTYTP